MAEMRRLEPLEQVTILGELGDLRTEQFLDGADPRRFGRVHRGGKTLYRLRIGDLRFYFEFTAEGIFCHHILPRHSFEDFCFRCGLASPNDGAAELEGKFWYFLEEQGERHRDNGADNGGKL